MTASKIQITKTQPELLAGRLRKVIPGVLVEIDAPRDSETGSWFVDAKLDGHQATIEWSSERGFGISSRSDVGYGERPDESFTDPEKVLRRVGRILHGRGNTLPPPASFAEIRNERGISQVELAKMLGLQQSSISKLENRDNFRIQTFKSAVQAMGGELDVIVRFSDGFCRRLELHEPETQPR